MKGLLYNEQASYEENYKNGPPITQLKKKPLVRAIKTRSRFLGFDINVPFGIPAGPLLNSKYIKAAFEWGFDVSTYKTVRADTFPCHPFPNVLYAQTPKDLHPDKVTQIIAGKTTNKSVTDFSITNSFGVPSKKPVQWQRDVEKALSYAKTGQLMVLSFMGTVKPNQTQDEFMQDFANAARLSYETGAKVLEANLSCPNIGNEGLVCYNLDATEKVCKAIRKEIGSTPLILKVGYYKNPQDIQRLTAIAQKYAQAIAAINTLQVEVVDKNGKQALPGPKRLRSGICGASIKWAGLEMVKKLNELRKKNKYTFELVGVGGVMTSKDYLDYRKAGADLVQSATGAMWNPNLAYEISTESEEK